MTFDLVREIKPILFHFVLFSLRTMCYLFCCVIFERYSHATVTCLLPPPDAFTLNNAY